MAKKPPTGPDLLKRTPLAEWIAAGLGLLLTATVLGYSLWEGAQGDGAPPALTVRATRVVPTDAGHLVEIQVRNRSLATAAAVQIEGVLTQGGVVQETSELTFDYVPGRGSARGGLVFERDPRAFDLSIVAKSYAEP